MKNKLLILFISTLLISCSATIYAKNEDKPKEKSPIVTLSASNYSSETAKGLVLVDFWAAWCGPCRRMAPILDEIAKEYKDSVKIGKVNVDNYKKFSIDLGVEVLPTIIVYKDGKEVTRIKGLVSKDDLVKVIKTYSAKEKKAN
ncbi:MAG: thioredoxin [Dysgonomonas sp.]